MIRLVYGGFSVPDEADLNAKWAMEDSSHSELSNHRVAELTELDAPLIIYNDRRQAIAKLNKRMMFAVPLVALFCLSLFAMQLYIFGAFFIAYFAIIYVLVVRRFNKNVTPLMEIDSTGISVHGLLTNLHVDWDNVQDVRPYTFLYRFVGIDPISIWKLKASLPTKLFLLNNGWNRSLYKMFGIKLSVINIPEQYSHFKAEQICEEIEKRRTHFLALPNHNSIPRLSTDAD
jgi:hypothetical protein